MRLTRRFHVGDLLALVTGEEGVSPRGSDGLLALVWYMMRYAAFAADDFECAYQALRGAVLAAYPELGAYTAADVPPPELLPAWRRRRAAEFGRYLVAPVLPPTHSLLTAPAARRPPDPFALRRAEEDRARVAAEARAAAEGGAGAVANAAAGVATAAAAGAVAGAAADDGAHGEGTDAPATEPPATGAGPTGSRLRRRFHVGDLLALTTGRPEVARAGAAGAKALIEYMTDRSLESFGPGGLLGRRVELRAALLAAYPEFGAYTAADVPPPEFLELWRRRREREFGRYLVVPVLPASHPLRAPPRVEPHGVEPHAPPQAELPAELPAHPTSTARASRATRRQGAAPAATAARAAR